MTSAYVFIQVGGIDNGQTFLDSLRAIPGVKSAHFVWGPIDCILFAEAPDMPGLISLTAKIRSTPGVASLDSRLVQA